MADDIEVCSVLMYCRKSAALPKFAYIKLHEEMQMVRMRQAKCSIRVLVSLL